MSKEDEFEKLSDEEARQLVLQAQKYEDDRARALTDQSKLIQLAYRKGRKHERKQNPLSALNDEQIEMFLSGAWLGFNDEDQELDAYAIFTKERERRKQLSKESKETE